MKSTMFCVIMFWGCVLIGHLMINNYSKDVLCLALKFSPLYCFYALKLMK